MRKILAVVVLLVVAFVLFGYWAGRPTHTIVSPSPSGTIGTSGGIDTEKARERGAQIAEKAAEASAKVQEAGAKVQETVAEAALTAKIKAKMALDDLVKARAIDVTTTNSTVTLTGTVRSRAEHDRAVALARETNGVTNVVDHLVVPY